MAQQITVNSASGNIQVQVSRSVKGYVGSQGDLGPQGYTGSQGAGFTGSQGSIGYTGSIGPAGPQGDIGYTGSQGSLGYTGSVGSQGIQGYTGSQGIQGYDGSLGYTGSQGVGFTGSQGAAGPQGFTGSAGASVPIGPATANQVLTNDGVDQYWTATISLNQLTMNGDIVAGADGVYDIGSTSTKFRDIYLTSATIYLGDAQISSDGTTVVATAFSGDGSQLVNIPINTTTNFTVDNTATIGTLIMKNPNGSPGEIWFPDVNGIDTDTGFEMAGDHILNIVAREQTIIQVNNTPGDPNRVIITANVLPSANNYTIGTANNFWNAVYATTVNTDRIGFDTTATGVLAPGELAWRNDDGTLDLGMLNGVTQQIGQDTYFYVKASTTITRGQVIAFAGAQGGNILANPANMASSSFKPSYVMGVAEQDIDIDDFGYVLAFGKINDLNTYAFNEGDILYLNPSVAGGLTATEPTGPTPKIVVAACVRKSSSPSSTNGSLVVRPNIGSTLNDLHNVAINTSTLATGQVLQYNAGVWINAVITATGTATNLLAVTTDIVPATTGTLNLGSISHPWNTGYFTTATGIYIGNNIINVSPEGLLLVNGQIQGLAIDGGSASSVYSVNDLSINGGDASSTYPSSELAINGGVA